MMMMANIIVKLFFIVLMISLSFCAEVIVKPKIYVLSGGATTPIIVYQALKPVYQARRALSADIIMTYQGTGSEEGIKRFSDKLYDFAASDVELPEADYGNSTDDVQMFPTMAAPVSLGYNIPEMPTECLDLSISHNPRCLNLTKELIVGIFNGTIKIWGDPLLVQYNQGLRNVNNTITVIVRSDNAGTTNILTNYLSSDPNWKAVFSTFADGCDIDGLPIKWSLNVTIKCAAKGQGVSGLITNTKYSIGYYTSSDGRDAMLPEARIQNKASQWVTASIEGTQAAMDATASNMGVRLTGSLVDAPSREAYPISGYSYLLVRKKSMQNCTVAMELYRFFKYVLEDPLAQNIMKDYTKAPVSPTILRQIQQNVLREMQCKGANLEKMVEQAIALENGTQDAWKVPVAVVLALCGFAGIVSVGIYGYVIYTRNKHVITNTFILHLETANDAHKSSPVKKTSLHSLTSEQTTTTHEDTVEIIEAHYHQGISVLRLANNDLCLVQNLCTHLSGETLHWKSRVLLVSMKDQLTHVNIVKVMGISFRSGTWMLVTACPSKGSLQDILQVEKYQLDNVFRYSIAGDIIEGMTYLNKWHIVHGQMNSACCYIDSKWNCVVGDWEQNALHASQKVSFISFEHLHRAATTKERDPSQLNEYYHALFWSAPETFDRDIYDLVVSTNHTFNSDVYSCAIVVYEIFTNLLPYDNLTEEDKDQWQPQKVLMAVQKENIRPSIPDEAIARYRKVMEMLQTMWRADGTARPNLVEVKKVMKRINPNKRSIIDTMMEAVENYAHSLEEKVTERTIELEKLTKNMETLLHSMMPSSIANKLFRGENVEPEYYESITLSFTDVVGFTSIAAMSRPSDVVTLLNDLYTVFDFVLSQHDIYKVETIGDCYMCVSGLPNRNGSFHSKEIANMALDMLHAAGSIKVRHMPDRALQVRVGAHSGSVMAGVVGIKMPRYCIFGDVVNTAARMESSSLPMRIQISHATKQLLDSYDIYQIILRGEREIKGKGLMTTYWLIGSNVFDKSLPIFDKKDDDDLLKLLDESQIK